MYTRISAYLALAVLLLAAFIPSIGAQPAGPDRSTASPRSEAIHGVPHEMFQATPQVPEAAPIGDTRRAAQHPEELHAIRPVAKRSAAGDKEKLVLESTQSAAATGSEAEPNDTSATANALAPGDVIEGAIDPAGDLDYFAVSAAAGDIFRFRALYIDNSWGDTTLTLYDVDGVTQLAFSDWYWNSDAQITYEFAATGDYYLLAQNYWFDGGPEFMYQIVVSDEGNADTTLVRASTDDSGQYANSNSYASAMSQDGRFIAFDSYADNLVTLDWNEADDIFVRDTQTNTIERVSVSTGEDEGNSDSYAPSLSGDGRYVVFYSYADNLVAGDNNGTADVFVHDRQTGTTTLVSLHTDGTRGNDSSVDPQISANGQYVVFNSYADNLVDVDVNSGNSDIFVRDLLAETTTLVSRHTDGTQGNSGSFEPSMSADGQVIAFRSHADNLVDIDTNGSIGDIFVRDLGNDITELVSKSTGGTQGNNDSYEPAISADGQVVAFSSNVDDLIAADDNGDITDIFVRDLIANTTTLVSRHSDGTQGNSDSYASDISGDGNLVVFQSYADNLIDDDINGTYADIFVHEISTGETTLVSRSAAEEQSSWYSYSPAITDDGLTVAFSSGANNLGLFDYYGQYDIFVRYTGVTLHTISGHVTDENDNSLSGMNIRDSSGAEAVTDLEGNYFMTRLLPGDHGIWVDVSGYPAWVFPDTLESVTLPPNMTDVNIVGATKTVSQTWFDPEADDYVDQAKKTANYGTKPYLKVRNASTDMVSYLRFDVSMPACSFIDRSELQLFVKDPGPDGGSVFEVSNDWTEKGLNWNNAPALADYPSDWFGNVADETYVSAYANVYGNGLHSFAVRSDSNDLVQYDSREGVNPPQLYIEYFSQAEQMPDAQFTVNSFSGEAPATFDFIDRSTGCGTDWAWDFGDGDTSTEANPSHTYTTPGNFPVSLTVTNSEGVDRKTYWLEVVAPVDVFDISTTGSGKAQGMPFTNADILRYQKSSNTWMMIYDGSDHGTPKNISAFAWNYGDLLLTFSVNQPIPGLGTATPFDVVRFTPDIPDVFPLGSGVFSWEFQGKDNDLKASGEKIDAMAPGYQYGALMFSMTGSVTVNADGGLLKAQDEDAIYWRGYEWSSYMEVDGSTITGMAAEDINGLGFDNQTGDYYVSILGSFNLGGIKGNGKNIVRLAWDGNGGLTPSLVDWLAPGEKFTSLIDALEISR